MKLSVHTSQFFDRAAVTSRVAPARLRFLRRAGGTVRLTARRSIKKTGWARKPPKKFGKTGKITKAWWKWWNELKDRPAAPPGSPIHTHTASGGARDAILFGLDTSAESVVVGFSADRFDAIGELHEGGGMRFGKRYPARPTIGPALTKVQPKLAGYLRDSIR